MTRTSKSNKKPRKKPQSVKRPSTLRTLREGRVLSLDLFHRHGWLILISIVVIIALIGQRYTNQTKMERIKVLTKELELQQSIEINAKAQYKSLIREKEMRRLLRENHLDLDYQEQPPYIIPLD